MKKISKLVLIGGGGHCRACIDVIESQGSYEIIGILDRDNTIGDNILGYPIIGCDNDISFYVKDCSFLITVGQIYNSTIRLSLYEKVLSLGGQFATIISKRAYVAKSSFVGPGSIIMHDALINSSVVVGDNCIINTKCLLEHDVKINSHSHISTAAIINGNVTVGKQSFIGSNSTVVNGTVVPNYSFVKAGSLFKGINNESQ
jgi:sugar O-acyltransferase (sialic acid O-acetyltransferase NeuD family)